VGVLDILKPILFTSYKGGSAVRVLQSVASGALGREAYQGGLSTALLGLGLHFGRGKRTHRHVVTVRIPQRKLFGSRVGVQVRLFLEPPDESACPSQCPSVVIDAEKQEESVAGCPGLGTS